MIAWLDILIITIIVLSTLVSLLRGFIREALSLAAWILAFWVALAFAEPVSAHAGFLSDSQLVRVVASFIALFLATLLAAATVNFLIGKLVVKTGLQGTDRVIGMVFGLARGVAVVAVCVLVGMLAGMQDESWWSASRLVGYFEPLAAWMYGLLPEEVAA